MKQAIKSLLAILPTVTVQVSASRRSTQREAAIRRLSSEVAELLLETTEDAVLPELAKI